MLFYYIPDGRVDATGDHHGAEEKKTRNDFSVISIYYHRNGGMAVRTMSLIAALVRSRSYPQYDYDMLDIPTDPEKMIQTVEFDYNCSFPRRAFVWLCADTAVTDIRHFTECPCSWQLNRKVENLTLISSTHLDPNCVQASVVYAEPEEWIPIAPNGSYPLPTEPSEVRRVSFDAKTDAGTTSTMALFADGGELVNSNITEMPDVIDWDIGSPLPASILSVNNTGSSTVYIRNLTTE